MLAETTTDSTGEKAPHTTDPDVMGRRPECVAVLSSSNINPSALRQGAKLQRKYC